METLLITQIEASKVTPLGGNVDPDKFIPCVLSAQVSVIEPLLGSLLYDKILTDFENDDLSGNYLTLFEDYIRPILINQSVAEYIEIGQYFVTNGGVYKHNSDNGTSIDKSEAQYLASKYRNTAQLYINRFNKWICKNSITEYLVCQEEVNAKKVKTDLGWYI